MRKKINQILYRLELFILGRRPFNTIFSFNYHNISHIVKYLKKASEQIQPGSTIVDVGAGYSPYYELFQHKAAKYIAVDFVASLPPNESRNIIQVPGTSEKLPLETESADVILSNQVLEHVIDERLSVSESFRVLKKGGVFIGSVPHISPIHLEPYDYRRFTNYGLKLLFEEAGFKIISIEGNGGVHRAMALSVTMDWFLTTHKEGEPQVFRSRRHFLLFPITGFVNVLAMLLDYLIGDRKRSPSNYCWIAVKQ